MKKFSKVLTVFIAVVMSVALFAGCDSQDQAGGNEWSGEYGPHGIRYAVDQTLRRIYSSEVSNLNAFNNSNSATDGDFNTLGSKALVHYDAHMIMSPALAYRWDVSDDGLVYTFYIREGLPYVDHEFNTVGYLTADDFVAVMEWVLDPEMISNNTNNYLPYILNAPEWFRREEGVTLDDVGFKAIDTYVLELTLQQPVPFFINVAGFRPVYRPFLEEHGIMYGTSLDTTIFIGPWVLTTFEPQFRRVWEKNPYYYDADNIYLERIVDTYNAEAGLLAPVMFRRGDIDYAQITADIVDQWMDDPDTRHIVNPGRPATVPFIWYYGFNFWPQFDEFYEPGNWDIAVNNTAFRRSLFWGLDTYAAHLPVDPFAPEVFLQSTIVPEGFANVGGRDFIAFEPLEPYAFHPTWLFDPEKALAYRDQAVEELTAQGVTFPIKVFMPYNPAGALGITWALEVQVVAQQLTNLFGPEYLEFFIEASASTNFLTEVRREGRYAFMKLNHGASVAPGDPEAGVFPWFTAPIMNWNHIDQASGEEMQALFAEYTALVEIAHAIPVANYERYHAFAVAEAFLLEHAFVIPYYVTGGGYHVRRYNPFEGYGAYEMEGLRLLVEPLTGEQWRLIYADWLEVRRNLDTE